MSAVIGTGNFPKALAPGVLAFWDLPPEYTPEYLSLVNDVVESEKAYEDIVQVVPFGTAPVKPQGRMSAADSMVQGYTTRATNVTYALQFANTLEESQDNLYPKLQRQRINSLKRAHNAARETVTANVLNFGFNSALQVIGDGQALFSLTHPSDGGAFANTFAVQADMSEATLEDMVVAVNSFRDPRGNRADYTPDMLICGVANQFTAARILNSVQQNDTGNNAINALRSQKAIPNGFMLAHYLTDTNAFFLKNKLPDNQGFIFVDRMKPVIKKDNDFGTQNELVMAYQRFCVAVSDPRCYFGSSGSS
jgi:hypothetical protein